MRLLLMSFNNNRIKLKLINTLNNQLQQNNNLNIDNQAIKS